MINRDEWRATCEQELGKPYIWGAEGPDSYDCSGFAQWALRHLNLDPPGDQTAAGLYRHFSKGRSRNVDVGEAMLGDLVFFGTEEAVTHIALAWGNGDMLEAGGGGRTTTTVAAARQRGAEVRIRPIRRRGDLVAILRPLAVTWGQDAPAVAEALASPAARSAHYVGLPPLTEWLADGRHMRLKRPFSFVDKGGHAWRVPAEAVVDGASIPPVFWSLIGGPFEGRYRDASIVHDYFCDVKTRPWQQTHRVFHEAMLASGVELFQANVMYYAVYRFGPRWVVGPVAVAEGFDLMAAVPEVAMPIPVEPFDATSFEADVSMIRRTNPDVATIEALANARDVGGPDLLPEANGTVTEVKTVAALASIAREAAATNARRPLIEQLVALQDGVIDTAAAEATGALLAAYSRRVLPAAPEAAAAPSFESLRPHYETLYASCQIRPERAGEVAWHRRKLEQYRQRYEAVSAKAKVPWWFIGVVHALEASFNFNGHLHNGDPLSARTVQVPKDRPAVWNPPNDWESSALDALAYEGLTGLDDWSVAAALYRWEKYNGFGYHGRGIESPYLWSFSSHYNKGKFVRDGVFDPEAVSKQCGAAVMLRALQNAGVVDLD